MTVSLQIQQIYFVAQLQQNFINCFAKYLILDQRHDVIFNDISIKNQALTSVSYCYDGMKWLIVCLIRSFTSQSTIFQLCWDGSSWVEPVLSRD